MTENGYPQARHSRLGEVTLWSVAALLMLGVHAGFAYYLMQEPEEQEAGGPPPAAIMIRAGHRRAARGSRRNDARARC